MRGGSGESLVRNQARVEARVEGGGGAAREVGRDS